MPVDFRHSTYPNVKTVLPGPESVKASNSMERVESVGVSSIVGGTAPVFWKQAFGTLVEDLDGNILLDLTSSFGVASIGYCHPRVSEALKEQCEKLVHTMQGIFPHLPYVRALESIATSVGRWGNSQVLLVNTGSEAIEVAMKLSQRYTNKPGVLAFQGGYHGQSLGALSATSINELRDPFASILSHNVISVPFPNPYRPAFNASGDTVADACLDNVERVLRGEQSGGIPIGSVLVEPMQNAGGYILPPLGFLTGLRELCDKYEVLLIVDEVFTGFGRTGYWLASDRENVVPDIVCVGKCMTGGVAAAACVADKEIMEKLVHPGMVPLSSSTFAGNALACTAIAATVQVMVENNLVLRAREIGAILLARIADVCSRYECVGDVRGLGMALAIEFVKDRNTKSRFPEMTTRVSNRLRAKGILTLNTALPFGNVLAICPPLIISDAQCSFFVEALDLCLAESQVFQS